MSTPKPSLASPLQRLFRNDAFIGLVIALGAFAVYLATLSPSLAGEEDQGELATAAYTLGNTHPTGYPLFALLGRAFALLPLGDLRVITRLNAMSALLCAAALFFFYRLFVSLLSGGLSGWSGLHSPSERSFPARRGVAGKPVAPHDGGTPVRVAAAAATLTLAFSEHYWKNALNLEVYGLHMLFVSVLGLVFVKAMREAARDRNVTGGVSRTRGTWLLFVYLTGLSFSNHMMTILLAPAFLWLYFATHGTGRVAWLKTLKAAPLFLLGLSAYIYLPVRAAAGPVANWGNPASWHGFWLHVSGRQYKAMMFAGLDVPLKKAVLLLERFPGVIGYPAVFAAACGLVVLWRRDRRAAAFTLLLFFTCLFYALNYDFDDPNFYLHLWMMTALWAGAGLLSLLRFAPAGWIRSVAASAVFLVPAYPLASHYRALDDSKNFATEDFAKNLLGSLERGAIILSNQSQYFTSPVLYLQFVEGYRPDVVVLQESALGFASYHAELKARHPAFAARHLPVPAGRAPGLEDSTAFIALYRATVDAMMARRDEAPVYFAPDIDAARYYADIRTVPQGLALRAYGMNIPPAPRRAFSFRPLPTRANDPDLENIRSYYATAYVNQAILYGQANDTAAVLEMLEEALTIKPGFPRAARLLRWVRHGY